MEDLSSWNLQMEGHLSRFYERVRCPAPEGQNPANHASLESPVPENVRVARAVCLADQNADPGRHHATKIPLFRHSAEVHRATHDTRNGPQNLCLVVRRARRRFLPVAGLELSPTTPWGHGERLWMLSH